jgi:hypothetical protein
MRFPRKSLPKQFMFDQKQQKRRKYLNYLGRKITDDKRCTRKIKFEIAIAKVAFNNKKVLCTSKVDLI